ncbi:pectate lyase-like adhesive domain-containing protein [Vagococcus bubulae]|uniref:pectate lyase-like adhesive domain-containing protein n=1 Tax=Vagococcus bubulae TaxID=1977868 RepID=UPI0022E3E50F|nr:pectate lyase-like adhesive domain-containing protein [Vagococcus bubulae]
MKKNRWMLIVFLFFCVLLVEGKKVKAVSGVETIPSLTQKQIALKKKQFGSLPNLKEFSLDSQGTGIVAYNFGKSMEDIKALNGNEQAAKEMILYESGATGYSLMGDVTDEIQVGDLGDLFSTSSNDLAEHHVTLTVPAEYSGTGKELSTDVIIYTGKVAKPTTWKELDKALLAKDVTVIEVQGNMINTINTNSNSEINTKMSNDRKDFAILGNGYSLDFLPTSYYWWSNSATNPSVTFDNIDLYGSNWYGPITMRDSFKGGCHSTYRNVNYSGSQVTASFQSIVTFEGVNNIHSNDTTYKSFDGTARTMLTKQQAGLESHTLIFTEHSKTNLEVDQGDGVILGGYYCNVGDVSHIQPSLTLKDNATVSIKTNGNSGENKNWGATQAIPSAINIQRNGRVDIGKNAKLVTETAKSTKRVPVYLGLTNNTSDDSKNWETTINMDTNSEFIITNGGPIPKSYGAVMLQNKSSINVGNAAKMVLNANNMTTQASGVLMGVNSKINVAKKSELTINKNGGIGNILTLSANSSFNVSDEGVAKFVSDGEGNSTDSMIYGADKSTFIIGERGLFTSQIKNGSGKRTMLDFATGANFQFANARRIDLDVRGNSNASLIGMDAGSFLADIQAVKGWTKADADKGDSQPTYDWSPMYGMNISYADDNIKKIIANSLTYKMRDDFIEHYDTNKLSRVLFDYIPDVHLGFDELSDNPDLSSSQVFKGVVNQGSSVAFYKVVDEKDPSKDVLLPHATVASPVEGEDKKYHLVTKNETYQFDVPSDMKLVAGDKIKVYGFLNGKSDSVINVVQDKTPPTAKGKNYYVPVNSTAPDAEDLVQDVADTNPNNTGFTYQYNTENPLDKIQSLMSELGEHAIKVDVSDEAGNTTTIDTTLTVVESDSHIKADDVSIKYKELRNMSKKEIENDILSKGNISAYKLLNGQKVDLTKYVTIKDLGGLDDTENIKTTPYTVSLVVPAKDAGEGIYDDIVKTMNVRVTNIDSVLTVSFVNEANKVLDHYTTTIKALVGDTLDLTKDKTIQEKRDLLAKDGYLLGSGPKNETAFNVADSEMVIVYHVEGTVMIQSVPTVLDFGTVKYIASPNRVEKPTYDKALIVSDTRANASSGWSMYAQMTAPLQSADGNKLEDVIHYVSKGEDKVLSDQSQPIFHYKENKASVYDISHDWGDKPKSDGIKLELGSSGDVYTGSYTGEITWKIMEGQP